MTRPAPKGTVFIVDDEAAVLRSLERLLRSHGFDVRTFGSARAFLERHDPAEPGCLILDVTMPELNGLELQEILSATSTARREIIFVTGCADVPIAVRAMRGGAADFLTKPVHHEALLNAVHVALGKDNAARSARQAAASNQERLATLTPREREVFEGVVAGQLNKQIAADLGTVEKTIKVHRGRVMRKMGADSLADLVRMALSLGIERPQ